MKNTTRSTSKIALIIAVVAIALFLLTFFPETFKNIINPNQNPTNVIAEDGTYSSLEDVLLYLKTYQKLPKNYITKKEAEKLGWPGGELDPYAFGKCIGGDNFGNYEKLLPEKNGRKWTECDIDTLHAKSRGAKRLVFSNDGLYYYTEDHYESFRQVDDRT